MYKLILDQNLNNSLIFKFFSTLSLIFFFSFTQLSILDEVAATGYCSNYSGYKIFDVDFGDDYMFKH